MKAKTLRNIPLNKSEQMKLGHQAHDKLDNAGLRGCCNQMRHKLNHPLLPLTTKCYWCLINNNYREQLTRWSVLRLRRTASASACTASGSGTASALTGTQAGTAVAGWHSGPSHCHWQWQAATATQAGSGSGTGSASALALPVALRAVAQLESCSLAP